VSDHVERLRGLCRLELPDEVGFLVRAVPEAGWERLRRLMVEWPRERGWPPPWSEVLRCLSEAEVG
jgi:hypothetical protein